MGDKNTHITCILGAEGREGGVERVINCSSESKSLLPAIGANWIRLQTDIDTDRDTDTDTD